LPSIKTMPPPRPESNPSSPAHGRWYPASDDTGAGWAHVSGWAQLHGTRRSVSCVIPVRDQLPTLRALLPPLSDLLTECGYPWEVIVIDTASSDGTERILSAWCELPGYRLVALDENVGRAGAIVIGFEAARGDAVILLDAAVDHPLPIISDMVQRWEAGASVVVAAHDAHSGNSVLRVPGQGESVQDNSAMAGLRLADDRSDLFLLDKQIVRDLLR
jgi:polyisoprenyl-phosphate glycosyltransferase